MAHRKQGYRFENDWTVEKIEELIEEEGFNSGVTIPVNVKIEAEQRVLNLEKVKEYLSKAHKIALVDCYCRTERHNCNAPLDVHIALNDYAKRSIESGNRNPRTVTMEKALDALTRSHEAGLVHMAYVLGKGDETSVICSCCSCCCVFLSAALRFGLIPHLLTSNTKSVTDTSKCEACGVCVERCQFGAREIVNNKLTLKTELCFGCGLCVSTCPNSAIKVIDK